MPFSRIVSRLSIRGMDGWMDGWMDLKKKSNDIIHRPIVIFFLFFNYLPFQSRVKYQLIGRQKTNRRKKGEGKKKKGIPMEKYLPTVHILIYFEK